jgi:hypothetical protein
MLRHVDDSVNVEGHFLRVRSPTLVAEAVNVLSVGVRGERVVLR